MARAAYKSKKRERGTLAPAHHREGFTFHFISVSFSFRFSARNGEDLRERFRAAPLVPSAMLFPVCPKHNSGEPCPCKKLPSITSIWTAASENDCARISYLVSARGLSPDKPDSGGYTALHYAARQGFAETVQLLLSLGADPDAHACGATPLHRAAYAGHADVCALLLARQPDLSLVDESFGDRRTALHKAAAEGHADVYRLLVDAGADEHGLRDRQGRTAAELLALVLEEKRAAADVKMAERGNRGGREAQEGKFGGAGGGAGGGAAGRTSATRVTSDPFGGMQALSMGAVCPRLHGVGAMAGLKRGVADIPVAAAVVTTTCGECGQVQEGVVTRGRAPCCRRLLCEECCKQLFRRSMRCHLCRERDAAEAAAAEVAAAEAAAAAKDGKDGLGSDGGDGGRGEDDSKAGRGEEKGGGEMEDEEGEEEGFDVFGF